MSTTVYPVRVDATLAPSLSRWLWLVKWLLAVPHFVVLAFLWLAFAVLSVGAFVAILVTGRYPRSIFTFNVGVLRWSWRVAFYAYGGLATDQYPPFTLNEVADYPAHLDVAYPERLSRGLVLVKWWLLAIPQYLVVAFFVGGSWYAASDYRHVVTGWPGGGLIGLLVTVAGVVLLVTGRYPRPVFDLVLGMNRWVLRVAAYVALMTDQYPPFRLDMGGQEPDGAQLTAPMPPATPATTPMPPTPAATTPEATEWTPSGPAAGPTGPSNRPPDAPWTAGRTLAVVAGVVVLLLGAVLFTAGAAVGVVDRTARDPQGFLMAPSVTVASARSALVSESIRVHGPSGVPHRLLGDAKLDVRPAAGRPVFVGVARTRDVLAYLAGAGYTSVRSLDDNGHPVYDQHPGGRPRSSPARAGIWVDSAQGAGEQAVTWPTRSGDWTLLVMNADGSPGVVADVAVGATLPLAPAVAVTGLVVGAVLVAGGVLVLVLAVRRRRA